MSSYGAAELANAFRTVRNNTILVAQDIPEDKYDFVVTPGFKTVGAQLKHIAFASMMYYDMHRDRRVTTLQGYDFGAIVGRSEAEEAKPRTKAAIIALLKSEGDRFATWLQSLSP